MAEQKKDPPPPDPIIQIMGSDLGPWQLYTCLLIFLSKFPTGWVLISHVFLNYKQKLSCTDPPGIKDPCSKDCHEIEFDTSVLESTIVSEWDLTCTSESLASMSVTILMAGVMFGNIIMGILADRFGRKPMFIISCMGNLIAGLCVSISPYFWTFCILRFLLSFSTGGMMVTSIVLVMEIIGKGKREIMSILYQIPFNTGHASLPLLAYLFSDWRWFHFSFSIFSVVYLLYFCLITESPRWLLTRGEVEKATKILEKAARWNKMPTENIQADLEVVHKNFLAAQSSQGKKKGSFWDLFRHKNLCIKTLAMAYNWMAVCLTYYGVAQFTSILSGNLFINVAIGACLGAIGTIVCVPMTKYLGRNITLIISNALSGITLILIGCVNGGHLCNVILVTLGLFGASVTFPNVYLYGGELFPTVVRNSGVGFCSFLGRVGSMIAPFINQLSSIGMWIPPLIFGISSILAALACLLMPETKGFPLPETIEEGEAFGKKRKSEQS